MNRGWCVGFAACVALGSGAFPSWAAPPAPDSTAVETPAAASHARPEALVPELAVAPYRLSPGPREFQHRISVSPAYGSFGSQPLFTFRVGYNPDSWLGYEAAIGHNPGNSVQAVQHSLSAIVRRPLPGRLQPYLAAGYGMMIVSAGRALNAAPVTKNSVTFGGGLEVYLRNDLALRADARRATVFGKQRDREGVVAYDYSQGTIGLAFYRSVHP